ncbi:hypothetical protein [Luteimonas aquatica]|uniref:hypothetical protein n=1 Tax=Luteimonas aquatica TaxID=450364 RepID=UPI001F59E984|nr:hypothetical protein [Luteimonas aquatica]
MNSPRAELRNELTAKLLPALRARGFAGADQIGGNRIFHDFRRPHGTATHVIILQLEKLGLPRFMLNLAIEPAGGFSEIIESGGTIVQGRVHPISRIRFKESLSLRQRLFGEIYDTPVSAVDHCLEMLPEIDAWWNDQRASANISVHETRYPGRASGMAPDPTRR